MRGGDDLDDDFVAEGLEADVFSSSELGVTAGEELSDVSEEWSGIQPAASAPNKKRKRKRGKEEKSKKRKLAEATTSENVSTAAGDPAALADYLAGHQKKTYKQASELELADMRIPESALADTSSFARPRTADTLCDFIKEALPTLKVRLAQRPAQKGAPTALVITSAALRAADLARVLRDMKGTKGGDVAKLFAKHFKLEEHAEYLRRTLVGAGVGTPGRLGRLLNETDAASLKALTHIILDVTFRDVKNRSLLDLPETRDTLFKLVLANDGIRAAIASGKTKVVLF